MSEEVLRFYQRGAQGGRGLRYRNRRPPYIRYTLLAIVVGVPLVAWWMTRDTWDMGALIPKDQNYTVVFPDLIEGRKIIAESALWELLPPEANARAMQENLQRDFGLPEWLVNNFVVGPVYISGRDFEQFNDAVLVTRMTRLGTLMQRFGGWSDAIEPDLAGGLKLARIKGADAFLAVRGRVLLASRDRQALIRSLVLEPGEAVGEEGFEQTLATLKDEMLEVRLRPEAWPLAAPHINAAELHLWLDAQSARAMVACRLTDSAKTLLAPITAKATPVDLPGALPGTLRLSANLGVPAPEAITAIGSLFGATLDPAAAITGLLEEEARPLAGDVMRLVMGKLGNSWSLSYRGINPMAFVPTPRFAGLFTCDSTLLTSLAEDFPTPPETVGAWQAWPRPSEDGRYVQMPLIGGPDLNPVLAPYAGKLLLATALPDAKDLLASPTLPSATDIKGNLLIEADPTPLLVDVLEVGRQFAELGVIRDHTPESLTELFTPWLDAANRVSLIRLAAGHDNGIVTLDLRLSLNAATE